MRMPVSSGVSENIESFSNFQHGSERSASVKKELHIEEGVQKTPG